jgi:hypothetical protein
MLIAETVVLLALETASGEVRPALRHLHEKRLLVSALMMELAVQTRIGLRHNRVVVLDRLPSRHPLVTAALQALVPVSGQLQLEPAIAHTERAVPGLLDDVLEGLVRRDWLHPAKRKYRIFGRKLYAVRSTQAQGEALELVKRAVRGEDNSLSALAMLVLMSASGSLDQLFVPEQAAEARTRLTHLTEEINEQLAGDFEQDDQLLAIALIATLAPHLAKTKV